MTNPPPHGPPGPRIRTDIVDVYIYRHTFSGASIELLQLLRARDPMSATWQPIMGHIEAGERAADTAWREVAEEVGLAREDPRIITPLFALEQVWPFYLPESDSIILSPRFALGVAREWMPALNHEHTDARWITWPDHRGDDGEQRPAPASFMWPGQRHAIAELAQRVLGPRH